MRVLRIAAAVFQDVLAPTAPVAVETTIVTHGMPCPDNIVTARSLKPEILKTGLGVAEKQ